MKKLVFGMLATLFSINSQAQNKNVKSEIETTITTTHDADGAKKLVKTQEIQEVQDIELKDADSNVLN